MPAVTYTVTVDEILADRLKARAAAAGKTAEELIADCISLHVDAATRILFLIARMELVDQGLIDIASFVGEVAAEGAQIQPIDDGSSMP